MAALTFPTPTQLKNIGDPTANTDAATKAYVDAQIGSGNSAYANSAGTVTANAQPNITSVGNLVSLNVIGNITAGNIDGGNVVVGNYFIGNGSLLTGITATASANANYANYAGTAYSVSGSNVTGQVGNALLSGTVYTNAQPNITSVGTLTSLDVTGNITAGNISGGNVVNANYFTGDGSLLTGISSSSGNANYANYAGNAFSVSGSNVSGQVSNALVAGTVYTNAQPNITSVGTLTTLDITGNINSGNANLGNAVTSNYFIGNFYGTANLATYATTANSVAGGNVSGQVSNALIAGTVYTNAQPNITSVGTLTDLSVSGNAVISGNLVVGGNTTYINVETLVIEDSVIELGSGVNGSPLTNNDGKDRGTLLHYYTTAPVDAFMGWDNSNAEFAFGSNVSVSSEVITFNELGNVRASYFIGNGSQLTGISASSGNANYANYAGNAFSVAGANVSGQVANALIAGTVYTNAQPNITSVGTLTSLTATGNVTGGNLVTAGKVYSSEMLDGGTGIYLAAGPSGYINFFTTGGDKASISDTGNIIASNVLANSTVFAVTANISGTVNAGNANLGNAVTANYFVGSLYGTANLATYATTANAVAGANVSGQVANALIAGTVYTNAQPNITSVGSLSGLTVSNATGIVDFTTTANVTLGAVSNLHISGGSNGQYLQTDGSGTLTWSTVAAGSTSNISNGNSNVNIATANGNITFSAVGNSNVMIITGTGANINGTLNTTGNVTLSGANVSLGAVGNVKITGGNANYVLSTDGTGNLAWAEAVTSSLSIAVDNFTGNGVQSNYTLTNTPANINCTIVSVAGLFQPRTVYSLTGNIITFSSAPKNTAPIEITTFTSTASGGGGGGGGGGYTYVEVTANATATANTKCIVNTNTSNITVTLPSSPTLGTEVGIIDGTGNASVHAITVGRNGSNIQGAASNMTVTTDRAAFTLVYYNAAQGWILTNV